MTYNKDTANQPVNGTVSLPGEIVTHEDYSSVQSQYKPEEEATKRILVVEDDLSTLEMIVELLKAYGYAVSSATDGEQARATVAQSLPELVILDLVLPKMSGFELLAEWRSHPRTADLSVFVLTSKDLTKEEEKYLRAHAESLFRKQDSWREPLIKQLERVVTSHALEDA